MMRTLFAVSLAALAALATGCESTAPKKDYPEVVFGQPRQTRPAPRYMPPPGPPLRPAPRPQPQAPAPKPTPVAGPERGWMPSKLSKRWTDIVIHHSATASGGARSFDQAHRRKGWDELGYHFVIGNGTDTRDGQVEVGSRWTKQIHGAHCRTPNNHYNEHGIGICLVGNLETSKPTEAQLASLNRLLLFLTETCHIPPDRVHTHGGLTGKTKCPGRHLSLWKVRKTLMASQTYNARG